MVHGGHHGDDGLTVGKGQDRDLGTLQELFHDQLLAALAELVVLHAGADRLLRLLAAASHHHALAQGQPVRLDHHGDGAAADIAECGIQLGEDLVAGGGDAVLFHQVLGEDLAALDEGGLRPGAEAGHADLLQGIDTAQDQGIVRRDHRIVDGICLSEGDNGGNVLGADGDAGGVRRDAAVAGERENLGDLGVLFQLADDGVLPAAAADNHYFHMELLKCDVADGLPPHPSPAPEGEAVRKESS